MIANQGAGRFRLIVVALFSALLVAAIASGTVPAVIGLIYASASAMSFAAYLQDKAAARAGRWRTPESGLHLLGLAGGWPGGLLAQQLLRHKSQKASFQIGFWVSVVANLSVLTWLMSESGRALLVVV